MNKDQCASCACFYGQHQDWCPNRVTDTPSLTTPIKQNSPDEEKTCCFDYCGNEVAWECRHGFLYCDQHHEQGAGPCKFKPFRKSKAGQVGEGGKSVWDVAKETSDANLDGLGKQDAVTDHAQAILQNALKEALPLLEIVRDYEPGEPDGACAPNRARALCEHIEELLSTQGVGEKQELENEALPASTHAAVATQTDSTRSLLECPFCGGINPQLVIPHGGEPVHWAVICTPSEESPGCGASGTWKLTKAEAIAAWNKRATPSVVAGVGDTPALEVAVECCNAVAALRGEVTPARLLETIRPFFDQQGVGEHAAGVSLIENLRLIVKHGCEDEEKIKELARPFLGNFAVDGDSYGVPGPVDMVEALIKHFAPPSPR